MNGQWFDIVRITWCQIVKDEMLDQVQSLDLLYEKETTSKMMEFKLKYLNSYANLLQTYFENLDFNELTTGISEASSERSLVTLTAMIVDPETFKFSTLEEVTPEDFERAIAAMGSPEFQARFKQICELDSMPAMSLQ